MAMLIISLRIEDRKSKEDNAGDDDDLLRRKMCNRVSFCICVFH